MKVNDLPAYLLYEVSCLYFDSTLDTILAWGRGKEVTFLHGMMKHNIPLLPWWKFIRRWRMKTQLKELERCMRINKIPFDPFN